jgi:hypothetical protein
MTSAINTGSMNVNYPIPGVNNSSQGMRDNWASIKTNLNDAGNEITDLQGKVLLKSALNGTTLNNDMANAQISNAVTLGFRASTFNLGNNLANTVLIDVTNGDVQYGTITANAQLQFAKWAPSGTQSNVQLILTVANTSAVLSLPTNVNHGISTIKNYLGNSTQAGGPIALPLIDSQVQYVFSTTDCGTSVTIDPVNIPRQSQQIFKRIVPAAIGRPGDLAGDVCIGAGKGVGSIAIVNAGSLYPTAPTVVISEPEVEGGTRATANATVAGGIVTAITITNSGSGYIRTPTVTISAAAGANGATANCTLTTIPNYMYYCSNNYDGATAIWNIVATQSWPT